MASYLLSLAADGTVTDAASDAALGPTAQGALVFAVTDVPPVAGRDIILSLARGYVPPPGTLTVPFERLVERRNGSCCGSCSG